MNTIWKKVEDDLKQFFQTHRYVLLFGAGSFSLGLLALLQTCDLKVDGIVVSQREKMECMGIPIYEADVVPYPKAECGIVFALGKVYHDEVAAFLIQKGFREFFKISDQVLREIRRKAEILSEFLLDRYSEYLPLKSRMPIKWDRILVIRLDGIGDIVLNTPFVRELRRNHPASHITMIVSLVTYPLMELCPYVDRIETYDWKESAHYPIEWRLEAARKYMQQNFRDESFDVVLIPRYDADYYGASFLSLFSNGTYRLAYSEKVTIGKESNNANYDRLFSTVISGDGVKHELLRNLDMLSFVGGLVGSELPELWCSDLDDQKARALLSCARSQNKIVAVGVDASSRHQIWDIKKYMNMIEILHHWDSQLLFFLVGRSWGDNFYNGDSQRLERPFIIDLIGKTTLRQLSSLMKYVLIYIGNDTGAMHIAAANGCRILMVSRFPLDGDRTHSGSIYRFAPWAKKWACVQPKHGKLDSAAGDYVGCIQTISVEDVVNEAKRILRDEEGDSHK